MRFTTFNNKSYLSKGFGLLDIMLALSISAVVLVLAVSYYSHAAVTQKVNRTIEQIGQIRQGVTSYIAGISASSNKNLPLNSNLTQTLINAKVMDPSTVTSVWNNQQMTIMLANGTLAGGGTCLQLKLTVCGIPQRSSAATALQNRFTSEYQANSASTTANITKQGACQIFMSCLQ